MQLIGAGLPRTATLSQKAALERLGLGPCYHMTSVMGDLDEVSRWKAALDDPARAADVLDDYEATVDWPGSFYVAELIERYPNAPVLLSVRDGDAWARSMRATIFDALYGDSLMAHMSQARAAVEPQWRAYTELMREMWRRSGLITGPETSDAWMATAMERYNEEIRRLVPARRLLEWSPSDGWEPLCAFLGREVPDEPFPNVNDGDSFADMIIRASLDAVEAHQAERVA